MLVGSWLSPLVPFPPQFPSIPLLVGSLLVLFLLDEDRLQTHRLVAVLLCVCVCVWCGGVVMQPELPVLVVARRSIRVSEYAKGKRQKMRKHEKEKEKKRKCG